MATPKVILLEGSALFHTGVALAAITPGHLVVRGATGIGLHSSAGGNAQPLFADFQDYVGKGIDTACAVSDMIPFMRPQAGAVVYALVAAGASAITDGDALESDGLGGLRKHTPISIVESGSATKSIYADTIVAYARETVDNSGGSAAVRIKAEVAK